MRYRSAMPLSSTGAARINKNEKFPVDGSEEKRERWENMQERAQGHTDFYLMDKLYILFLF